jgi:hypothetical protein
MIIFVIFLKIINSIIMKYIRYHHFNINYELYTLYSIIIMYMHSNVYIMYRDNIYNYEIHETRIAY